MYRLITMRRETPVSTEVVRVTNVQAMDLMEDDPNWHSTSKSVWKRFTRNRTPKWKRNR